ncbi:class A beta-lactamase [Glaciihabitans sp. UYNi722]|uniref:class A beta-lactamase n=1 Tax=Glaciihabitans sp. UYNi722 TaxID=3156344 RepID=UPI003396BE24
MPTPSSTAPATTSAKQALAELENSHHARLGLAVMDTGTGRVISYRAGERFAFASTNKTFIAAAILQQSSPADLATVVHYSPADLLAYAPITSQFVDSGMTVRQLLDAMLRFSDNTAANILVNRLGGPSVIQQYLRGLGDNATNVDRLEPDLNQALPDDARDTTTPQQFANDIRGVVLGSDLGSAQRVLLRNEMLDNTTGDGTIRAGVDTAWPVADKTGTGDRGIRNDIAVVYPTGRAPIVVVVMTVPNDPTATADDPLVAAATRTAIDALDQ